MPVPGKGTTECRDDVTNGEEAQCFAAAIFLTRDTGGHGPYYGANESHGHRETELFRVERIHTREGGGGAGNYRGVETEKQAAQGTDDGRFGEVGVHSWPPLPALPSCT